MLIINPYEQLTPKQIYQMYQLRVNVFVIEQQCIYSEIDEADIALTTQHILLYANEKQQELIAYARCLGPNIQYSNAVAIGRIVVTPTFRKQHYGQEIIIAAINTCQQYWPNMPVNISAQAALTDYYQHFGFEVISEIYLEDNIPHIAMKLKNNRLPLDIV